VIVAEAARAWREMGISTIPILDNGTKRPAVRWAEFQGRVPELGEVDHWWGNGREFGLALICGQVSGNLEMTEIEGRAASGDSLISIENAMDAVGATSIWNRLTREGYLEMSPSGGLHLLYRISDHPVPGNTKIATDAGQLVLAETRGEGGYVIVAPTSGLCHPSGESWSLLRGVIGHLPLITWQDRCLLHEGLRQALDTTAEPAAPELPVLAPRPAGVLGMPLSPNDDFEARTDWQEILEPHGWRLESTRHGERFWTRPGKNPREGASATTGKDPDRDRLYVFSTSTIFNAEQPYTKYMAWTLLNFNGDKHAATKELVRRGFGEPARPTVLGEIEWPEESPASYPPNDTGLAAYLYDQVRDRFLYLHEEKCFYHWDGSVWRPDNKGALTREHKKLCEHKRQETLAQGEARQHKWWVGAGNVARIRAAADLLPAEEGMSVDSSEMNVGSNLLNVGNGILDLQSQTLIPHDPSFRQTRLFGASFDPTATCPNFEAFLERALPDESMRRYVQRALGYSLLGDVDQRAMFLIYGPSGTGKSTLMETMRHIFADYGVTAASGTFRARGRESSPTNDVHGLRNKRFVTTSETAEGTSFDEDLLKRLTGRDSVTSRELYQSNQEWVPECTIWMATNHPPRFNSDDDAIWRRAKLIPFTTQFAGAGEIHDMARRILAPEADGILNWLLAGLADFLAHGLDEPETVAQAAKELRAESDSVLRFVEEQVHDHTLELEHTGVISSKELYSMYQQWCLGLGERPLRARRFRNRLESSGAGIQQVRDEHATNFVGLRRGRGVGLLGTFRT